MLNILQCKICNTPYQSFGGKLCPSCLASLDWQHATVRDYIYDNPDETDLDKIAEATEVPSAVILYLLKEERLSIKAPVGDTGLFSCEVCHKPINGGKMCEDCKRKVADTMLRSIGDKLLTQEDKKGGSKNRKY